MDKWLDSLQKTAPAAPPAAESSSDALATIFGASDDAVIAPERVSKVFDDGSADVPDPVAHFFEKNAKDKLRIPEFAAPHADGTELEKVGNQVWKHTWQNGVIVKSECNGEVVTDESEKPLYITNELAKVIGLDSDSMHADVGLAGFVPDLDAA